MILDNRLNIEYSSGIDEYPYHQEFTDDLIEREIVYDSEENSFISVTGSCGINIIENIYADILPIHVELIQRKQQDMVVKDRRGRLTLISVMPF